MFKKLFFIFRNREYIWKKLIFSLFCFTIIIQRSSVFVRQKGNFINNSLKLEEG